MTSTFDTWGGSFGASWGQSWTITIPAPPDADQGAGGLNVYDPSAIREYRKRALKSQQTQSERDKRIREEREELELLVHRAYNKALGIEEPVEGSPSLPAAVLPRSEETRLSKEIRERASLLGLQASLSQIAAIVRVRKAEAMAEAYRQDVANREQILLAAEAEDDAQLDAMMDEAERLFKEASEMLK